MKKKIIIVIILLLLLGFKVTYSVYTNNSKTLTNLSFANFIVDTKRQDHIDLDLSTLNPGDDITFNFSISNGLEENVSDVSIVYNIIIKTMHFMPLDIKLYDINDNLIMSCDETYKRNTDNELVCMTDDIELLFSKNEQHDYYLKIDFPVEYNSYEYSSLVDYLNIQIKSSQKID